MDVKHRSFIWMHLTAEQLHQLRNTNTKTGNVGDLLTSFLGLTQYPPLKKRIFLDLLIRTLKFGEKLRLTDAQISGLFSIMKEVHEQSTCRKMQIDDSFLLFKELLLTHTLQRPPYSIGLFSLTESNRILAWVLDTYYRHYKLYMYSFTDRVLMTTTQSHPMDQVDLAITIPPLNEAMTEQEHIALVSEEQRKIEEEERLSAEAEAVEMESRRKAPLKAMYAASVPLEIREAVEIALKEQMAILKNNMDEVFSQQQEPLLARLKELELRGPEGA